MIEIIASSQFEWDTSMPARAKSALAYGICLACAGAGLAGVALWAIFAAGLSLSLIAIWEQQKLKARFNAVGANEVLTTAYSASVTYGCLTAASAWSIGFAFRLALQSV